MHCRQWYQALQRFDQISGEARLELIRGVDLLRREQRLCGLLACSEALSGGQSSPLNQALPALLAQLNAIAPKQLMAEGFKGKALGTEIARRQLQLCEQFSMETDNG